MTTLWYKSLLCFLCICFAISAKQYSFDFSTSDYQLSLQPDGITKIVGNGNEIFKDSEEPAIPYYLKSIALPYGQKLENYTVNISNPVLIAENVIIR